jgi:hypothetical protein
MRRSLSDEEVRGILENDPFELGLDLVTISEDIVSKTDFDPEPSSRYVDFGVVENWVRDISSTLDDVESLSQRLRTEQIEDEDIERELYKVSEQINKLIVEEYRDSVSEEINGLQGQDQIFGARNFMADEGFELVASNKKQFMRNDPEMYELWEEQDEGRPGTVELARAYAELLLDYKDNVGGTSQNYFSDYSGL